MGPEAPVTSNSESANYQGLLRADAGTRTGDPFITSEVLYQLSYVGVCRDFLDLAASAAWFGAATVLQNSGRPLLRGKRS